MNLLNGKMLESDKVFKALVIAVISMYVVYKVGYIAGRFYFFYTH